MIERSAVVLVLAFIALGAALARADVIELTDGGRVEGTLKEATPAGVAIEVGGQTIRFEGAKVRAIYFGTPEPVTTAPAAEPPVPAALPAPPNASTPTDGALQLVRRVRSTVASGATQREYEGRVNEAAPMVDLYLNGLPSGAGTDAIRDAMRYYVLAKWAWSNQGKASHTVWLRKDEALPRCSAYQDFTREMQSRGEAFYAERLRNYVVIGDGVIPVLWTCAAEKIDEAEKVLAAARESAKDPRESAGDKR